MDGLSPYLLNVFDSIRGGLEQLTELAKRKIKAVESDDLLALDDVMNQEQAVVLSMRGLEQKRERVLSDLGLSGVPLSQIAERCPPDAQPEVRQAVEALKNQYQEYRRHADRARNMLEHGIREIERTLSELGASPIENGPGYGARDEAAPPESMKTDFRA